MGKQRQRTISVTSQDNSQSATTVITPTGAPRTACTRAPSPPPRGGRHASPLRCVSFNGRPRVVVFKPQKGEKHEDLYTKTGLL